MRTDVITRTLTALHANLGIRSLITLSTARCRHHIFSALPPRHFYLKARPKPISGRTSYLRVRLEFHRYPQVIPSRFLVSGFGPPVHVTEPSSCSWIDHSVSGLFLHTKVALLRLAFASAPSLQLNLACKNNSPVHSAKGTPSPINGL